MSKIGNGRKRGQGGEQVCISARQQVKLIKTDQNSAKQMQIKKKQNKVSKVKQVTLNTHLSKKYTGLNKYKGLSLHPTK